MRNLCQWTAALTIATLFGCAESPDSALRGGETPGAAGTVRAASVGHLQALEARQVLADHGDTRILDVRQPEEWDDDLGHIDGARLIPLPELPGRLAEIEDWKDQRVIVVCRVGGRSDRAARILAGAGFRRVMNLEGGMVAWRQSEGAAP